MPSSSTRALFGAKPVGMWPSEGSVAQEMIAAVAAAGIQWIASDEEILTRSTEGWVARDAQGHVQRPELLYQPWRVESGGQKLQMIFRDHALSDLIGFNYQRYEPEQASDDLVSKLEAIGRATEAADRKRPSLVSIILDGENCWEYYPDGGVQFLRLLYKRLAGHAQIKPVRVRDYLAAHPPTETVGHLFAGSWISHNFAIWIGHPACNRAWDLLAETRAALVTNAGRAGLPAADLKRAWEELYIAEGSDWFWWFDDRHSSSQDWLFDELFRKHLQNVYTLLGLEPAAELLKPIGERRERLRPITQPTGTVQVRIDGRQTYFEWINAGVYTVSQARGTMAMAESERIDKIHFGFEPDRLLLRFDAHGHVSQRLADVDTLRVVFGAPAGYELVVTGPATLAPKTQLFHNDVPVSNAGVEAASDVILEIGIPWRALGAEPEKPLAFHAELLRQEQPIERVPHEGAIETTVPSPDYDLIMWQA